MKTNALIIFQIQFFLLFNISISKSQAPNLGLAFSFALFTSEGAFGNVGNTAVIGDIGTNVGEFSGFPVGTVDGRIFLADSISAQAAIDVHVAYSLLYDKSADRIIGTTLDGQILQPGVSSTGGASSLAGVLTLDANYDANALFIIKIGGALLVDAYSSIVLINAASWDNVYWQIDGKFDLGANAVFKGTVIANGAINLLANSALQGRGLSCGGAISLDDNTIVLKTSPLPIDLLSFSACNTAGGVQFDWYTASEVNNDYFTVLQSFDGTNYSDVIKVKGAGNSNSIIHYVANKIDFAKGLHYYRLKQTDFDAKSSFSNIVSLDRSSFILKNIRNYPNPFAGRLMFDIFDDALINDTRLKIYNMKGEVLISKIIDNRIFEVNTESLCAGMYNVQLEIISKAIVVKLGSVICLGRK